MKRFNLLTSILLFSVINVFAEGYQVNTLSTKQVAMAHTGVSQKLGAESMYFNPAGLAFSDKMLDLSLGVTGIASNVECTTGNKTYETDNKISTPLFGYAAFRIYDNLKVGVAFYTPYGSGINWGNNWPGAILSQKVKLSSYVIQPTVSWRITKKLSIGAGVSVTWGSVDLSKGMVTPESIDALLAKLGKEYRFGDITPISVNLVGTSNISVGFNVGIMYDINSKFTVGASYRSETSLKVKSGDVIVNYANENAQIIAEHTIGLIKEANFKAEMPLPHTITFGASYRPNSKLELNGDVQFTGWKTYKELDIDFISEQLDKFDQKLAKNYHNTFAFRLGVKYQLTERFDILGGMSYDMSPIDKEYYNPETPGMGKISPSLGFSFRPFSRFSVNLACAYVAGVGANGTSYTYIDPLIKVPQKFEADYKVTAWTPSISVGYTF